MAERKINTLMMIDDNDVDQMLQKRIAIRSGLVGCIQSYLHAEEALEYLAGDQLPKPEVILLDINMPRMDGFEFLEALEQLPDQRKIPVVVMLTTSLDPKDMDRSSQFKSVKMFMSKPLSTEILETIAEL